MTKPIRPRIALFQPEIPQNTGTIIRMAACLGLEVDLIEPAAFSSTDKNLKRAGMDYLDMASLTRHASWEAFYQTHTDRRLVLLTTKASQPHHQFKFSNEDVLILGRESSGVPDHVHEATPHRIKIPMVEGRRSLNQAVSAALAISTCLEQLSAYPHINI